MTGYSPEDLPLLERIVLGALCIGLPPSRAAGSDAFRVDHVCAVIASLAEGGTETTHLAPDGMRVAPAFRAQLRAAIESLGERGLVIQQAPGMPAAVGGYERGLELDLIDPDEHPVLLDRYLGQQCMETLFSMPAVYPFLMDRYTKSGEVWRRLREGGYAE